MTRSIYQSYALYQAAKSKMCIFHIGIKQEEWGETLSQGHWIYWLR